MASSESAAPEIELELMAVHRLYSCLARGMDAESGLGGKLLYAGELDDLACRLVRAANIAGVATLAAAADPSVARRAMRDGVIDFVVTSLAEALRILKNEIRKRNTVAVAVAASADIVLLEMIERGVLPDFLPPASMSSGGSAPDAEFAAFIEHGAVRVARPSLPAGKRFVTILIPAAWGQHRTEFDALLLEYVAAEDHAGRRWLQLSPRYLGPQAKRLRSLECAEDAAARLLERVEHSTPR
jgi:Urocanase Rossmann-like domain